MMCILLLLCAVLALYIHNLNTTYSIGREAGSAALQANARFNRLLTDSSLLLDGYADQIDAGTLTEDEAVHLIDGAGLFSSSGVEKADGLMAEVVFNSEECSLQLRKPLASGLELTAMLDNSAICASLSGILDGEYDYTLYNLNTGACLICANSQETEGYYDVLLEMSSDGSMEELRGYEDQPVRVLHYERGSANKYIAITEIPHISCGISLSIDAALLNAVSGSSMLHLIIIAVLVLLMICCILSASITMRRIRNSNRNIANALTMSDRMVDIAARDGRTTLLVVSWKRDGIFACHDGLGLTSASNAIRSISDLEQVCGMDEGEMDRVYECLNKLAENESAELTVHCYTSTREDRLLRISFHRTESKEKNFLCCISDCTREQAAQYRAEQEQGYIENVRRRTTSIWQVNVSRNRWRALHTHENDPLRGLAAGGARWRDYSSDLSGVVCEHMHPADYPEFSEHTGIPALASAYRSGVSEFTRDYRMTAGENGYEWHRMCVRFLPDPKTDDILANYYVYNVDAKKNAELERGERKRVLQQSMTALSGIFAGLYYVDLDNDLCYTAKSLGGELTEQLCASYKETVDTYIETAVHPDDREKLRSMLGSYQIKRSMAEGSHFRRCTYRRRVEEDSYGSAAILLQPARFENGTVKEITIAFRYTDQDAE